MNCAICGNDNQAGTRFCVHCGAALVAPAGTSPQNTIAAAGAILSPKKPAAAGLSGSEPTATIPPYTPRAAPPPEQRRVAAPSVEPAPPIPAYNADPKRAGLIVVVIAAVGVLAAAAYVGFKVMSNRGAGDVLTRIETPPSNTVPSPRTSGTNEAPPAPEPPKAVEAPSAPPASPVETRPATPEHPIAPPAPPPKAEAKATRASPSGQASRQQTSPSAGTPPSAPAAQPPVHAAAPAAPAAAPVQDRWAQFAEELHRCQGEAFLSRVVCDQRVRLHYCDGYWGKVPQCPGAIANPDRGQ